MRKYFFIPLFFIALFTNTSCDKNNNFVLLFSVQDDKDLGLQVSQQIADDPQYTILSRNNYPEAYSYLDGIVNNILNSGEVAYKDEFAWEVHIVHDDDVLNAFATPGGYIYVYTGLIKYLDNVDALAGVMGHEIAHADLRHTSRNLQKQNGVALLLNIILGKEPGMLEQIAGQIAGTVAGLSFSRKYETESDMRSVEYLSKTIYACDGAKIFFEKLEASGNGSSGPQFLSTHPNPENRIEDITAKAQDEGCDTSLSGDVSGYTQFQNDLP